MNAMEQVGKEGLIERFLGRVGARGGLGTEIAVLENSTEELVEDVQHGRAPSIFRMRGKAGKKRIKRREENFLYSTRRFPAHTSDDTISTGAVAAQDYPFFNFGVGDQGSIAGYASIGNIGFLQTNMDKGGRIPTGRGFALYELAVSFNAMASPGDIAQLMDTCELRYSKNNDDFTIHHGPVRLWPGGTGVNGFAGVFDASGGPGSQVFAENGMPTMQAVRRFKQPRLLSANESFSYVIRASANLPRDNVAVALGKFTEMTVWLFGYHFTLISS
jgi:hypothetical protein